MGDEGKSYICEKCGVTVEIGDYPYCKGGHKGGWSGAEEPCEEFVDENIDTDPVTFTSKRAWVRHMDRKGFEPAKFRSVSKWEVKTSRGPTGKLLFVDMGGK